MKKLRITIDVECGKTFDMLQAMHGNAEPLGTRLAGLFMTGAIGFADEIGLGVYGIKVAGVEDLAEVAA